MELSVLASQAVEIVLWAIDKTSVGALGKAGANVLEFLTKRFQGKLQISKSQSNQLEAAILSEAQDDNKFREELESLVNQYQKVQSTSVFQNTESGVNSFINNNSGTFIGQQIEKQIFR